MKYSITINDDDYLKFNLFYTCRTKNGQRSLHSIRLFFPIICVILLFSFSRFIIPYPSGRLKCIPAKGLLHRSGGSADQRRIVKGRLEYLHFFLFYGTVDAP